MLNSPAAVLSTTVPATAAGANPEAVSGPENMAPAASGAEGGSGTGDFARLLARSDAMAGAQPGNPTVALPVPAGGQDVPDAGQILPPAAMPAFDLEDAEAGEAAEAGRGLQPGAVFPDGMAAGLTGEGPGEAAEQQEEGAVDVIPAAPPSQLPSSPTDHFSRQGEGSEVVLREGAASPHRGRGDGLPQAAVPTPSAEELTDGVAAAAPKGESAHTRFVLDGGQGSMQPSSVQGMMQSPAQAQPASPGGEASLHVQQASTAPPAPGGERPAAVLSLSAALHQQARWGDEMGHQVKWLISRNLHSAEMKLNPPHMGAIEIRISVQQDQVHLHFATPHAVVRDTLEESLPRLRDILQASGLDLVNVDVSQQDAGGRQARHDTRLPAPAVGAPVDPEGMHEEAGQGTLVRTSRGLLDLYA